MISSNVATCLSFDQGPAQNPSSMQHGFALSHMTAAAAATATSSTIPACVQQQSTQDFKPIITSTMAEQPRSPATGDQLLDMTGLAVSPPPVHTTATVMTSSAQQQQQQQQQQVSAMTSANNMPVFAPQTPVEMLGFINATQQQQQQPQQHVAPNDFSIAA